MNKKFAIHISTKNRVEDLVITLNSLSEILLNDSVECVVYDDGSTDGTDLMILEKFPAIKFLRNKTSKGYIYCRNYMLNETTAKYVLSLDDDATLYSNNVFEIAEKYFISNPKCALIATRIFWGKFLPDNYTLTNEQNVRVNGFVGCGHIWNLASWKKIPSYPEWFEFYGEENFASFQIFKHGLEIIYLPEIFIQHRVDVKSRIKDKDYQIRRRRSLRAGWYNYFLFYPISIIPKKMAYSIWQQVKNHTLKGNVKATLGMLQAIGDVVINIPKLIKNSNRLTSKEFKEFSNLPNTKIYWNPENE
jgi:glycosyltransferase involved in cell wall biosynthesis